MTQLSTDITLKMPLLTPASHMTLKYKTNTQAFIALSACISSPLSLYLDPLPEAIGFLQRAVATGPIWPSP